ncbi:MAG: murein biosynthesis integral membrane protein MurJ [Clostridia bacterium]|nr:murein biosynthesis integral membrane protein MurJ [Clostridia bacterium]
MSGKKKSLLQTTMAVTLVIFVSKAGGFLREIVMTAYYGAGTEMDAYNMAYSLYYVPVLLFNSCITSTLVPLYVQLQKDGPPRRLDRFGSNVINLFAVFSLAVSFFMFWLAGSLVRLTAQGFDPGKQALTTELLRRMLPSLPFLVTSIVLSSILNAREKYLAAQLTGFPLTFALLIATIGFSRSHGIHALTWGVFVSGILQVVILLPAMKGLMKYRLSFDLSDPVFRRLMALAGPAVLSMAVNELNHMVDKMLATGLPEGHLSCMSLAFRLITFLVGVVLVPLETITFSRMSMRTASHDHKGVGKIVRQCAELVALVIFPVIVVGAVMSKDVIRLAYRHGVFSEDSVSTAAYALLFYIVGVFSFGMRDILNRAFHACQDTRTPMINAMATVALNILLNVLLVRVMGVGGLALATSLSATVGALSLLMLLRRKIGRFRGRRTLEELIKTGIAAALCAFVCIVLDRVMPPAQNSMGSFIRLVAGTGASFIAYIAAALALRVRQIDVAKDMILKKLGR